MRPWSGAAILAICALGCRARVEFATLRSATLRQPHRRLFWDGCVGLRLRLNGFRRQGECQAENPKTVVAAGRGARCRSLAGVAFVFVYAGTSAGAGKNAVCYDFVNMVFAEVWPAVRRICELWRLE